jgi:hypothetical protein
MSFFAVLVCSDEGCAASFEAFGRLEELERAVCSGCGCCLEPVGWGETVTASRNGRVPEHAELELVPGP